MMQAILDPFAYNVLVSGVIVATFAVQLCRLIGVTLVAATLVTPASSHGCCPTGSAGPNITITRASDQGPDANIVLPLDTQGLHISWRSQLPARPDH